MTDSATFTTPEATDEDLGDLLLWLRRGPAHAQDWGTLWRFAAAAGVTWFGAGAAFYAGCLKAGVEPMAQADLWGLRAVGSTAMSARLARRP